MSKSVILYNIVGNITDKELLNRCRKVLYGRKYSFTREITSDIKKFYEAVFNQAANIIIEEYNSIFSIKCKYAKSSKSYYYNAIAVYSIEDNGRLVVDELYFIDSHQSINQYTKDNPLIIDVS